MKKIIAVVGAKGKMGSVVCDALKDSFCVVKIDKNDKLTSHEHFDLVIDFASAESSVQSAKFCLEKQVPLIVGSTGQTQDEISEIKKVASVAPLVISANFSIGIMILKYLIKKMTQFCTFFEDVVIFEKHHKLKKDAPSGTAKEIQKMIFDHYKTDTNVICERGGKEVGTHLIDFYLEDEVFSIEHRAFSRKAFADGVKLVALNIFEKEKGFYEFSDFVKNE